MKRRRFSGRRTSVRRPRRWTAQGAYFTLLPTTLAFVQLVVPADYQFSTSLEPSSVTLARLRLSLAFRILGAAAGFSDLFWAVVKHDASIVPTLGGPLDVDVSTGAGLTTWINEEILASGALSLAGQLTSAPFFNSKDVDIRAMRKLTTDAVSFIIQGTAGTSSIQVSLGARALLIGG